MQIAMHLKRRLQSSVPGLRSSRQSPKNTLRNAAPILANSSSISEISRAWARVEISRSPTRSYLNTGVTSSTRFVKWLTDTPGHFQA